MKLKRQIVGGVVGIVFLAMGARAERIWPGEDVEAIRDIAREMYPRRYSASTAERTYFVSVLGDTHFDAEPASVYHAEFQRKYGKDEGQWWRPAEFARNAEMWAGPSRRILEASGRVSGNSRLVEGRLVEFTMNTVYGSSKGKPNPAEPLVLREGPAAYGDVDWVKSSPAVAALFDEYRPYMRRYFVAKGVGHARMRVSDDGVRLEYYGHDAQTPTKVWHVAPRRGR